MKTNLYILIAFLMEIGMLVGCSADGIPEKRDEVLPDGLTYIRFGVEAASDQGADENTLQNLTVLQFDLDKNVTDVTEQNNALCVTARYLRNPEPETDVDGGAKGYYLIGLKASTKDTQYLVFIANAGSMFQDYKGTLGDFKALTIPFDQKTNTGENQLMLGAGYVPVKGVDDEQTHPVILKRLVAQIHFNYTKKLEVTEARFTPISLRLRNVPKVLKYADGITEATDYPEKTSENFTDYTSIIDKIEEGFTWYIPQNVRTAAADGSYSDDFRTYVELSGIYEAPNMQDQLVTYKFYPGKDDHYNVSRNYSYEMLPVVGGVNSFDANVSTRNLTVSPSANCFVVAPEAGSEVTFDPHDSPGTDVAGTEIVYADQVIENQYSRIADVRPVWQTAENLIDVIFADGLVRVVPNAKGVDGNALIAAYAADGTTILWSWHIWVTPYAKVLDGTGTNGYIHTQTDNNHNTYEWMDRNLGALNTYREDKNRNLYYQWGRKDPFYDKTQNSAISSVITAADKGNALNFDVSVKNPTVFFQQQSGKSGTWHGGSAAITNLWDPNTKTVFDPCPAGWRVPAKVAWEAYKWGSGGNMAWDTANPYGTVWTVGPGVYSWFPRGALNNSIAFDTGNAYMWSTEWASTTPYTYKITSSSGSVANTIVGSLGGSVRCVKVK